MYAEYTQERTIPVTIDLVSHNGGNDFIIKNSSFIKMYSDLKEDR